jgi:uncharacterized protein YoxC
VYISLYDIGAFVLFIMVLIGGMYLIAVLHRTFSVLGYVKEILDDHGEEIRQTIAGLPEALGNVNELAVSLKETADQTNNAFGSLQHNITDTVEDLRDGMENIIVYGKVAAEIFQAVFAKK